MSRLSAKLLKDYMQGKLSEKGLARLAEWLGESPENPSSLFSAELLYREGKADEERTRASMNQAEAALFDRIHAEAPRAPRPLWADVWRYAAAVLAVFVLGGAALWALYGREEMVRVAASGAGVTEVTLPDSSKVWLNKGGAITYARAFDGRERRVELEGEALFSVAKNPERPFIVASSGVETRVLGTVFDFNSRAKGNKEEVSLLEGRVEITGARGEGKVILKPNQKAVIDKNTHTLEVQNVYAPLEAVWHDGMIPFENMTISQIARVLERFYGVQITLSRGIDRRQTYSGYVRHGGSIDSVLTALKYTVPFDFYRSGQEIVLFGAKKR